MPTFKRLLGFLRPYRRPVALSFVLAGGAIGMTVLIPYLTGVAIADTALVLERLAAPRGLASGVQSEVLPA